MFNIDYDDGIVILGKRGSGKTTLIKQIVKNMPRKVIIDIINNLHSLYNKDMHDRYFLANPHTTDVYLADVKSNSYLILDEADRIYYSERLQELINLGRNWNIGYVASARRTANINKDYLANAKHLFIFKHKLPQDVKMLTEWIGDEINIVMNLKQYEFCYFINEEYIGKYKLTI